MVSATTAKQLRRGALLLALLLMLPGGLGLPAAAEELPEPLPQELGGAAELQEDPLAPPEDPALPQNPCGSLEELLAYLEQESVTEITLTDDLFVDQPTQLWADRTLTVQMGYHCIVLEAALDIGSPMHFVGEGGEWESAKFILSEDALTTTSELWVEVNGDGAVAVRSYLEDGHLGAADGGAIHITANGLGSVALRVQGKLTCTRLELTAENGFAAEVDRIGDVQFEDCALSGEILDWQLEELPGGAPEAIPDYILENIDLYIVQWGQEYNLLQYGLWFAQGEELLLPEQVTMLFLYADDYGISPAGTVPVPVVWEWDTLPDAPGSAVVTAIPTLSPATAAFENLVSAERYELTVQVADPSVLSLTHAYKTESWEQQPAIVLNPTTSLDETWGYRLWVRAEGGDWESCSPGDQRTEYCFSQSVVPHLGVCYLGADFDLDYEFKLEILEGPLAGMTQPIRVAGGAEFHTGGRGGDRDGTGQGDQGERPDRVDREPFDGGRQRPQPKPADSTAATEAPEIAEPSDAVQPPSAAPEPPEAQADVQIDPPEPEVAPVQESPAPPPEAPSQPQQAPSQPQQVPLERPLLDALLEAQPHELTFIENDLKLVLPRALLQELDLAPDESLTVALEQTEEGFAVHLSAGDREVGSFAEPFFLHLPYRGELPYNEVSCTHSGGETCFAQGFEQGKLIFCLYRTGRYVLHAQTDAPIGGDLPAFSAAAPVPVELAGAEAEGQGVLPALPLMLGCAVLSQTVVLLARRRGRSGKRDE